MNLHQVLTGAVNPGDNCFSVGNINNQPFTAYASGCDVVILGSDFERLQIIPGAKHGNIQVGCVDCSLQGGQIAASYGSIVCIFQPVLLQSDRTSTKPSYQWQRRERILLQSAARNLAWHPAGTHLLTGSTSLQLWSCRDDSEEEEEEEEEDRGQTGLTSGDEGQKAGMTISDSHSSWRCIWNCRTASPVHLMKFSPDGEFFATAGQDDCLVKVWYSTSKWQAGVSKLFSPPEPGSHHGDLDLSFVYLAHPRSVTGLSWRKTSRYMPRGSVCNVLLTCCKDSVCRLWAETLLPGDSLLSGHHSDPLLATATGRKASSSARTQNKKSQELNLQESWRVSGLRGVAQPSLTGCLPHQAGRHHAHKTTAPPHANGLCHFHIAASINPATDIPLLPSISSLCGADEEEPGGPFTVHWLNNKELHLTLAMEVFLQQLRGSLEGQASDHTHREDVDASEDDPGRGPPSEEAGAGAGAGAPLQPPALAVEHHVEVLLDEWSRAADMLFSIHPMDGSLLVWHVDWLDEFQPGMFRQVQVSFVSRIPVAFPTGDANSLSRSVVMYACNKNVDLAIQHGRRRPARSLPRSSSTLISYGGQAKAPPSAGSRLSIFTPNVLMISTHADGSLNQWAVSFAEDSAFSTVLSVSHVWRYCGHRFHLNDLACHPLLPLLLTTSHHNALRTPDTDALLAAPEEGGPPRGGRPSRASLGVSRDPSAIYSELVLWRVDPVGPLSFSGGVSELARINSLHASAFSNVAWLPALVPSSCLGMYCSSPSACFVASDGQSLRLYQAVIEAKKLLSELSNPEIAKSVGEVFNIISQQSTAKPGCIIELDTITDFQGKETQLLHVFEEDLILGSERPQASLQPPASDSVFCARFFLVVVELTQTGKSLLHMWHLQLDALPVTMEEAPAPGSSPQKGSFSFSPPAARGRRPCCTSNLQSARRLSLSTQRLCSQDVSLPPGIQVLTATPSAGHLSASSLQPAGRAPYLIATSCSDNQVRFWRCSVTGAEPLASPDLTYQWEEWPLLVEEGLANSSAVSVSGRPVEVSCCHTSRLAVAYRHTPSSPPPSTSSPYAILSHAPNPSSNPHLCLNLTSDRSPSPYPSPNSDLSRSLNPSLRAPLVHVEIFQCESTGGSQWVLEQTLTLEDSDHTPSNNNILINNTIHVPPDSPPDLPPPDLAPSCQEGLGGGPLVHLDWVSREDGSHILTVGVGSRLYMYGLLSGKPPELGLSGADRPSHSPARMVLLRSVELVSSVEGSLPVPVCLSWVRDGILVVGMDCEMHVYSQWQPPSRPPPAPDARGSSSSIPSTLQQSQEEGLAPPRRALTRSMTSLAQKLSGKKTAYDLPVEMEDCGLFEAAHHLSPTLPQYHPIQLLELMDLGKVHRAKAILSHLVKCIAGEIVALRDSSTSQERRLRSRAISAGGSTARDSRFLSKAESSASDYTEIDSIPPLPLYALLAADQETSSKPDQRGSVSGDSGHGSSQTDAYDELFHAPPGADLDPLDGEGEDAGSKVIDLSRYSPAFFGPEHAQVLSSHLLHSSLPGLTRMEQMSLMALADTIASTSTDLRACQAKSKGGETLDECGLKFLLAVRLHTFLLTSLPPAHRSPLLLQGLSTCHYAWAFHSEAEEELVGLLPGLQRGDPSWAELCSMGLGWWLRSGDKLRRCIEKVAKVSFQRNNDPLDAAVFYLAMKKKAVVWGLYRSQNNSKMTAFFSNNFSEERWRKAALKNAFSLLGKQRFQHAAAFFLLAGSLRDAVEVCVEKLQDLQLALVIARLYESEFETASTYKRILHRHVLGRDTQMAPHPDPFLRSMALWVLEDYSHALETLLEQPASSMGVSSMSPCNPEVFNFYTFLRTHPLLLRRHLGSSERARGGLTAQGRRLDSITLLERKLFFTAAHTHLQAGCPMLALEVLSKMPKAHTRSRVLLSQDHPASGASEPGAGSGEGEASRREQASELDWSQPVVNGTESLSGSLSVSRSESVLSFDWSQPCLAPTEPLDLKWDDDEEEGGGCVEERGDANNTPVVLQDSVSPSTETSVTPDDDDAVVVAASDDILAAQLKFGACLKILTAELRTLASGSELDGGKLRHQLCLWLEREVAALRSVCNYTPCLVLDQDQALEGEGAGGDERGEAGEGRGRTRRLWLQRNQPLLRMFLSYCSLHGSHGGGLASVRMELILLLQESQQDDSVQSAMAPSPHHHSIPLLLACTASAKTVVANPIVHLTNLTHDILHTINALDSPPHPDLVNNEIYVMHSLAASLSACIYQCLCAGHTHSHVNQFTGMVYQSELLCPTAPPRTTSLGGTLLPNTPPAQWPGMASLVRLLSSAGEDVQPSVAVLLCEILSSVFLSLFVHGLATHSSNELFRVLAHPLNSKLWVAVFGGGAMTPALEKASPVGCPPVSPSSEDVDRKRRRFRLLSSRSGSREASDRPGPEREGPGSPPPVAEQQEAAIFKEHFVPPELSIWDFFIAKPFLPPSESRVEYDSEESQDSQEEEDEEEEYDEDTFESSSPLREHSNHNSYSWCLMRLSMVQLVLGNLKSFYPMAGYDLLDLPVASPLCHAVLKTLQRWEQVLLKRLELFGGPPCKYISTPPLDQPPASGPAILRHKALFEPSNTPFRSSHHSALPVRRLWQYLVKQEEIQETFIRNIFTKKRDPSESVEDHSVTCSNTAEEPGHNQIEADQGYPGGKARIIHKESDIITAFAINKANRNCLVVASTHDIQELDVSSILATQILTWVDDEAETEAKGLSNEDFLIIHARDDFNTLHGTTPYTHSSPGTPINMPWLGGLQTGRGAAVLIKRNINNVRRMTSHPTLPYCE
ncbi:dmX-like protein 1 isoform X2 [Osmerus eperlanus]|uniref:dmX-like protein 1 isoform X2 n=1 Tax=Osmerus eperlanus TaxID=29151 RepID=UPI002E13A4A2